MGPGCVIVFAACLTRYIASVAESVAYAHSKGIEIGA